MRSKCSAQISDLMGSTVLGERGQVVIPKDIRQTLGLEAGSRLVVLTHENDALIMIPVQKMKKMLTVMNKKFAKLDSLIKSEV